MTAPFHWICGSSTGFSWHKDYIAHTTTNTMIFDKVVSSDI